MKKSEPNKNRQKSFSKYGLTFLLSVIFTLSISAKSNIDSDVLNNTLSIEKDKLEKALITNVADMHKADLAINEIEVFELEEGVELGVVASKYLPENFNPLKGKNDLDWNTIEIIEIEEEVELDFDTTKYLPENFNPFKGRNDLDWSTIELIELEEEVDLGFDTKDYLPQGFDAFKK